MGDPVDHEARLDVYGDGIKVRGIVVADYGAKRQDVQKVAVKEDSFAQDRGRSDQYQGAYRQEEDRRGRNDPVREDSFRSTRGGSNAVSQHRRAADDVGPEDGRSPRGPLQPAHRQLQKEGSNAGQAMTSARSGGDERDRWNAGERSGRAIRDADPRDQGGDRREQRGGDARAPLRSDDRRDDDFRQSQQPQQRDSRYFDSQGYSSQAGQPRPPPAGGRGRSPPPPPRDPDGRQAGRNGGDQYGKLGSPLPLRDGDRRPAARGGSPPMRPQVAREAPQSGERRDAFRGEGGARRSGDGGRGEEAHDQQRHVAGGGTYNGRGGDGYDERRGRGREADHDRSLSPPPARRQRLDTRPAVASSYDRRWAL